ncbi:S-layer homology domain-containing protein [Ezakiella peruensis]|uniref:S-layer homology domain-containing protein n=1 Tax=Ezakiella peruensis TaxID=1464038 RepID=UPI000C1B46E5|nr:S-layer homology domain-containing protein [Ezakiella peruensis]
MKRTLSILLALLMLVSLVPFHALAENVENAEGTEEVAEQAQDQEEKQEVQEEKEEDEKVSVEVTVEDKTDEVTGESEEENPAEEVEEKKEEEIEISEEKEPEAVGDPEPNVTLVGQWVKDSSEKTDTPKYYELTDKIGTPLYNSGLLRGLAKQFLVWSDKEPTANGVLPEGARIFSPEDKISDVFPNGIPEDAKLYAVYYEINNPYGKPFPQDPFSLIAVGSVLENLKGRVNNNKVTINENVKPDDVLKNTENHESGDKIVDYYKETDDDKTINEVTLKAEFEMDWVVAMLAYRNQTGSNQLRPILSRDYNDRYKNSDFSTEDGEKAGYTYVDLNMNFGDDDGLVIPDNLGLEFKSYSWRPLYAFGYDEEGNKVVLNKIDDFKGNVKGDDPKTQFNVKTDYTDAEGNKKNYRNITVRVVLREWDNTVEKPHQTPFSGERISESKITPDKGKTIAETIISNMTLRVMGSEDELENKDIIRISDKKAKALAEGQGKDDINITGSIQGHIFASAGSVSAGKITFQLKQNLGIDESEVKDPVKLSYVFKEDEPEPKPEPKPEPYDPGYWYDPSPDYLNKKPEAKERTFDLYRWYVKGNEGDFMPYKGITRAEIAEIFARALDYDKTYFDDSHVNYPDVDESAWYAKAVARVTNAGIFKGTDEGNFEPTREITQGELISTLKRFQKLSDSMENIMTIRDDHWARAEVNAAAKEGWLKIYQEGTKAFDVDKVITREEVVAIANKAFARPVDQRYIDEYIDSLKTFKDINKDMWSYYEILIAANTYFVNYDNKDSRYDLWVNHATFDDGPTTAIEDIKTYREILNNDEYRTNIYQVRFQRDLYR